MSGIKLSDKLRLKTISLAVNKYFNYFFYNLKAKIFFATILVTIIYNTLLIV